MEKSYEPKRFERRWYEAWLERDLFEDGAWNYGMLAAELAALLAGRVPLTPRIRIGVVISGGNIDPELARCLVDTLASPTAGAVW